MEIKKEVRELLAQIILYQGRDNFTKCEADYLQRYEEKSGKK